MRIHACGSISAVKWRLPKRDTAILTEGEDKSVSLMTLVGSDGSESEWLLKLMGDGGESGSLMRITVEASESASLLMLMGNGGESGLLCPCSVIFILLCPCIHKRAH